MHNTISNQHLLVEVSIFSCLPHFYTNFQFSSGDKSIQRGQPQHTEVKTHHSLKILIQPQQSETLTGSKASSTEGSTASQRIKPSASPTATPPVPSTTKFITQSQEKSALSMCRGEPHALASSPHPYALFATHGFTPMSACTSKT